VVATGDATVRLGDGQVVTIDGSAGTIQVLHAFGLADVALLEDTSLGGGILEAVPESDLRAADGALAAVHVTVTKPVAAR
jgi:hypothetical protein